MGAIADFTDFPKGLELIEAALSGRYRIIVYGGAVRGGKSFNSLIALYLLLRKNPGSRAAIIRKDNETLKRNTLPTVRKILLEPHATNSSKSPYTWQINTERYGHKLKSEVFFFGENYDRDKELQRWDGLETNFFFIDQMEEITEEGFNKAIERVGAYFIPGIEKDKNPKPLILATVNPTDNWVRRLFYDRWKDGTLPKDWLFIEANIYDNPHVPREYIEQLEQLQFTNPSEYERRVKGNWDYGDDELSLFTYEVVKDSFSNSFVEEGSNYITADIALEGADEFIIGVWNGLRLVKFIPIQNSTGKDVIEKLDEIAKYHSVPQRNITYDADGVGGFIKGWLSTGIAFRNGSKAVHSGNFENLKTQCYYRLSELMNENKIFLDCEGSDQDLISQELRAHKRVDSDKEGKRKMTKKEVIKSKIGRSPDRSDMLAMRMIWELHRFEKRKRSRGKPKNKINELQ